MHDAKRWMCVATPADVGWSLSAPEQVGPPDTLLARLLARAGGLPVAFGIDCPIGLPREFAALHVRETDFPDFLNALSETSTFFDVAATLAACGPASPFYPARGLAGMTRLSHAAALGLRDAASLSRRCDRATLERPAGAPLFWTLGANQTGKAAISAWRDMLIPALAAPHPPRLWPFEGAFLDLLAPGRVVIAETYPAEAMRQLGIRPTGSKRRQADRAGYAPALHRAMARLSVVPDAGLRADLAAGFGAGGNGEDRLDCVFGVLCVLSVLLGHRIDTAPEDPAIHTWEGWVLGQSAGGAPPFAASHEVERSDIGCTSAGRQDAQPSSR